MKTVILYATKYGCTEKAAAKLTEKISEQISSDVTKVNLKTQETPDLIEFDCIILGGSIYAGRIQKEIKELIQQSGYLIKEKPLGLFVCCGFQDKAMEQMKEAFGELYDSARVKEYFGAMFNTEKMNFAEKLIVKVVSRSDKAKPPGIIEENIDEFVGKLTAEMAIRS
ncbi:flavodoxin domain-containing protein [Natranaerofaba carboxydovora]|uniref:flavodoxin domain-containing protein n=1 Tax=Natranaerofaba carboxydovora TaxID=2742683 RepID=UPI001F138EE1|nr:flavodoxin domain-containing protein [Natranaerofaba carboxydovora]UMZ74448.1 Flavodoxin domain protein [Natranaerofaba carboxydovora]